MLFCLLSHAFSLLFHCKILYQQQQQSDRKNAREQTNKRESHQSVKKLYDYNIWFVVLSFKSFYCTNVWMTRRIYQPSVCTLKTKQKMKKKKIQSLLLNVTFLFVIFLVSIAFSRQNRDRLQNSNKINKKHTSTRLREFCVSFSLYYVFVQYW